MTSSDAFLKATLKRLARRLEKGASDLTESVEVLMNDAPERLRKELQLFYEEVIEEAELLEKQSSTNNAAPAGINENMDFDSPQKTLDRLRAKVANLNSKIETIS